MPPFSQTQLLEGRGANAPGLMSLSTPPPEVSSGLTKKRQILMRLERAVPGGAGVKCLGLFQTVGGMVYPTDLYWAPLGTGAPGLDPHQPRA